MPRAGQSAGFDGLSSYRGFQEARLRRLQADIFRRVLAHSDRMGHDELGTEHCNDEIDLFELRCGICRTHEHRSRGGKAASKLGPGRYQTRDFGFPEDSVAGLDAIRRRKRSTRSDRARR